MNGKLKCKQNHLSHQSNATRANAIQREKCKDDSNTKKDKKKSKKVIKLKNQNFRTPENQSPQKLEI